MSEASEPISEPKDSSPAAGRRSIVRTINKATRGLQPVEHSSGRLVRSGQIVRSGRPGQASGLVREAPTTSTPLQAASRPKVVVTSKGVEESQASRSKPSTETAGSPVLGELTSPQERYDNASAKGFQDGYAKGIAQAQAEMAADRERQTARLNEMEAQQQRLLDSLERAVSAFDARVAEVTTAISDELLTATFDLVEGMVGHELRHCPKHVVETVISSLSTAGPGEVTVRVHPADMELLGSEMPSDRKLHFIADESVDPGGCLLDVGPRTVDARVNEIIARTKRAFLGVEQ